MLDLARCLQSRYGCIAKFTCCAESYAMLTGDDIERPSKDEGLNEELPVIVAHIDRIGVGDASHEIIFRVASIARIEAADVTLFLPPEFIHQLLSFTKLRDL